MAINFNEIIGKDYGRLKVIEYVGRNDKGHPIVRCMCSCGNEYVGNYYPIRHGNTSSCGCYRSDYVANKNKTHGLRYSPIYKVWVCIKGRCYNKNNKDYRYYGAVGIGMSHEWFESFENFYNDMFQSYLDHVEKYGKSNTSLDRIDPNKGYSKDNCRWATWKEQNDSKHKRKFRGNQLDGE